MQLSADIIDKTISPAYRIERLSKDNLIDLAILYRAVFEKDMGFEYFQKKYDTAYTGAEYIGFLAYDKQGMAVAYNGVIPCFIKYENELVLAAQAADYMTHPDFRYKGLLVELSNLTFTLCQNSGIKLLFGFPNQHSYHGVVNRLGWKPLTNMSCFVIKVKSIPWGKLNRRLSFLKKWYANRSRSVLKKYRSDNQQIHNSVVEDGFAGVHRSSKWFQYKSYSSTYVLSLNEARIWVTIKQVIMIGDIEGLNSNNLSLVIRSLKKIASELGIRQIQFHCCPGTMLHDLFSREFKALPSYPVLYKDFGSPVSPEKLRFSFADIDIF